MTTEAASPAPYRHGIDDMTMTTPRAAKRRAGRGAALGNSQTTLPPQDENRLRPMRDRRSRHALRHAARSITRVKRLAGCGHPIGQSVGVKYDAAAGAGFSGIETCGSVWGCAVCAAKISARRSIELEQVLSWAASKGFTVAMVTLTVRHKKSDRLRDVWDAVGKGWNTANTRRAWKRAQEMSGFQGWVSAVEVTIGDNGWHVHRHVVLVFEDASWADRLGALLWDGWLAGIERCGFTAIRDMGGFDMTIANGSAVGLGAYLAKMGASAPDLAGLAREATHGMSKNGRRGGRSPFEVLAWGIATGDADDLALWWEWEKHSRGRRFMGWSGRNGKYDLRAAAALDAEQTDEEVAAEVAGGDFVLVLPRATYKRLQALGMECDLLDLVESHGDASAAIGWLSLLDLAWSPPPERT